VRVGEEHDIGNLVEYLNTQTIREWETLLI
jgi:hypothetical protein